MKVRTTFVPRHLAGAVALAAGLLAAGHAQALGLGRITVQSALGEVLRAEIDVSSISGEETSTLQLRVADAEVYRSAGIDYNAVLAGATIVLDRRPDGRAVLRLRSERPVVEPFLDVIVEANWSSGRLVRAYTMLLDPPGRQVQAPAQPATQPVAAAPAPSARPAAPAAAPQAEARAQAPRAEARPAAPRPAPARADAAAERYRVRSGDTLSGIASRNLQPGVSLDQMLVALFRANPQAFAGKNMNRLLAGAVLDMPAADEAGAVDGEQARQLIVAQSADFDAFRQRLASGVRQAETEAPSRQAKGTVQAVVDDRKAGPATPPDKLTLTRPSTKASEAEAQVSKEAERRETAARVAELTRNVEELKRLQQQAASPASAAPAAPAKPPAPAAQPEPPKVVAAPPPPASAAAPAVAVAKPPVAKPPVAKPAPAPVPAEEPGMFDALFDNPLVMPGAVVLVALLAGLGIYRMRGRRKTGGETSFLESRLQPDSFFGASGGQRIDTHESTSSGSSSSMSYSLSQLDAIGDVDPVAEADVYLAYGRDLQAEEILKEAMRVTPERQAIRLKLLEVYAKRRDTKGLELLATQVFSTTKGEGEDWEAAQEIGRSVDPENPLYQPGGQPAAVMMQGGEMVEPLGASTLPATVKPQSSVEDETPPEKADLGLDLDLDLGASVEDSQQPMDSALSFELPEDMPAAAPPAQAPAAELSGFGALDFELDSADKPQDAGLSDEPMSAERLPDFAPSMAPGDAPISDFGSAYQGDPLERKLELAEEFRQIGDTEGARDLLEEVIGKAEGAVKTKAQRMLDGLA